MKTKSFITALIIIVLTACSSGNNTARYGTESSIGPDMDKLFESLFPEPGDPGAIVLIARGDSVIYERAFGMATLDRPTEITDSTLFNICSVSKQFGAVALLKLQEQGKLSLNDTVSKYFPQFPSKIFGRLTLRHLLSHTSGLPDTRPRTPQQWEEYRLKHSSVYADVEDYKKYAMWLESCRFYESMDTLMFTPGTKYEYQNPTYQLILPIVEQLTGQNFGSWMKENIFRPAGMNHTFYFEPDSAVRNMAHAYIPAKGKNLHGYYRSPDGRWEECDYGEANFFPTKADGGIYTSAKEFALWQQALMDGKIIKKKSLAQAFKPIIDTDIPGSSYGLGFFIEQDGDSPRRIYHTGDNGAFLCYEAYYPKTNIKVIVFANRNDWPREQIITDIDSILARNKWI